MWEDGFEWVPEKTALYRKPYHLYPDIRMRDVPTVFPISKVKISYGGYRVRHLRVIDVEAVKKRLESTNE